jgi:hypothetical protein
MANWETRGMKKIIVLVAFVCAMGALAGLPSAGVSRQAAAELQSMLARMQVPASLPISLSTQPSGLAHKASVDSSRSGAAPAVEPMKIVPADVLGTGVSWSPLTGDGSN